MPRYRVTEIRAYRSTYLIDSETEEDAEAMLGEVVPGSESDTDSWGERTEGVEQVADDEEC